MLTSTMTKTIAVVGAGRVGQTLARAWRKRGYRIGAVVTRRASRAKAATRFIGGGQPQAGLGEDIGDARLIFIATPDRQVALAARALARKRKSWRGCVVLQASGALSSRELAPLARRGAAVGSLHPLYPFPRPLRTFPRGVVFGIEGDRRARQQAIALARALQGQPMEVRSTEKALYHAAAALVAGHLLTLADLGVRALERAGVRKSRARRVLVPLAQATLACYARWGGRAWTGPLERGDVETVRRHLRALRHLPRGYANAYVALAQAALGLYRGRRRRELRRLLRN